MAVATPFNWDQFNKYRSRGVSLDPATATARVVEEGRTQDAANKAAELATLRTTATGNARNSANAFFKDRGLDPSQYTGSIDDKINSILSSTAEDDPNVGAYLSNVGQSVYSGQQDAQHARATTDVNRLFTPDYERSRVTDTLDDPILSGIDTQQRGSADEYITNLLNRHVITGTGAQGAEKNLDAQGSRVRNTLNTIGANTLSAGRQSLTDIANRARSDASTVPLGTTFDAGKYGNEADSSFDSFLNTLGDSIKAKVPGNLYDTSGLAAIAGSAQGAQNLKFDPLALAGNLGKSTDNIDESVAKKPRSIF